jgi:branched-subunit amino acid transport protein
MKSKLGKLNLKDWLRGLYIAVATPVLGAIIDSLNSGTFSFSWEFLKPFVIAGISAGLLYWLKNLLTNSQDKILTAEK